jgi:hypothetical protein
VFPSINDLDNNFIKGILVLDIIFAIATDRQTHSLDHLYDYPTASTHLHYNPLVTPTSSTINIAIHN